MAAFSPTSYADDPAGKNRYSGGLVLKAGLPPFPPFAYPNNKSKSGTVVDIYRMLETELGEKIRIHYYPYPRVIESMKNGDLDIAIIFKNASLKQYVTYAGEVSKSKVLVIPNKGFYVNNYEDLYKLKSIAVLRRANFEPRFDKDSQLNKFTVVDYSAGLKMMNRGRASAIVGSQSGLYEANRLLNYDIHRWNPHFLLNKKEWWLHVSNKSPYQALIPKIKKAVRAIYSEDLVWQLYTDSLKNAEGVER
ncbi:substrate-binding periplasmic protein [Alkalimarinus coralli]|uniref:substrate-binding periplasmic protein n=1 Tax=Alkalimarinus coralli TaxID=2935863 RepID=UPI00202B2894|nr:transporter substrate-binding domain-containing protein [Alkalimarinus coralli]